VKGNDGIETRVQYAGTNSECEDLPDDGYPSFFVRGAKCTPIDWNHPGCPGLKRSLDRDPFISSHSCMPTNTVAFVQCTGC